MKLQIAFIACTALLGAAFPLENLPDATVVCNRCIVEKPELTLCAAEFVEASGGQL